MQDGGDRTRTGGVIVRHTIRYELWFGRIVRQRSTEPITVAHAKSSRRWYAKACAGRMIGVTFGGTVSRTVIRHSPTLSRAAATRFARSRADGAEEGWVDAVLRIIHRDDSPTVIVEPGGCSVLDPVPWHIVSQMVPRTGQRRPPPQRWRIRSA